VVGFHAHIIQPSCSLSCKIWGSHSDLAKHSNPNLVKCDVSMGEHFPLFWRHQDPSKWWEPLAQWHSIKSQITWIFQVFSVTFMVLRVVSRGSTLLWSGTMYFIVWLQHAGITHCHKVEECVTCQSYKEWKWFAPISSPGPPVYW